MSHFSISNIYESHLDLIDHEVAKDRLIKVQKILFQYQLEHNESFLGKKIDVLVENKMKKNQMYFGRNKSVSYTHLTLPTSDLV